MPDVFIFSSSDNSLIIKSPIDSRLDLTNRISLMDSGSELYFQGTVSGPNLPTQLTNKFFIDIDFIDACSIATI